MQSAWRDHVLARRDERQILEHALRAKSVSPSLSPILVRGAAVSFPKRSAASANDVSRYPDEPLALPAGVLGWVVEVSERGAPAGEVLCRDAYFLDFGLTQIGGVFTFYDLLQKQISRDSRGIAPPIFKFDDANPSESPRSDAASLLGCQTYAGRADVVLREYPVRAQDTFTVSACTTPSTSPPDCDAPERTLLRPCGDDRDVIYVEPAYPIPNRGAQTGFLLFFICISLALFFALFTSTRVPDAPHRGLVK